MVELRGCDRQHPHHERKTLAAGRKKMVRTIWEQAPSFKDSQLDLALYLSATKTNHDLEAALKLMQNFDASMLTGALEMVTNADAKNTAKAELKYQVENSQDMADVRGPAHETDAAFCGRALCLGTERGAHFRLRGPE